MSRTICTGRYPRLYKQNFSFFVGFSVGSYLHSFISDFSGFLFSFKYFQFNHPYITVENTF